MTGLCPVQSCFIFYRGYFDRCIQLGCYCEKRKIAQMPYELQNGPLHEPPPVLNFEQLRPSVHLCFVFVWSSKRIVKHLLRLDFISRPTPNETNAGLGDAALELVCSKVLWFTLTTRALSLKHVLRSPHRPCCIDLLKDQYCKCLHIIIHHFCTENYNHGVVRKIIQSLIQIVELKLKSSYILVKACTVNRSS